MCEHCRQNHLLPEFESILHAEYEEETYPERETGSSSYTSSSSRNSATYIKWVQTTLNQLLKLRLTVDGITGPMTRSAIRSFQSKNGLRADGIVGAKTETALIAALKRATLAPVAPYIPGSSTTPVSPARGDANLQKIINAMVRKGYIIYQEPNRLNIAGIRSAEARPNNFDDSINVFYKDNTGNWQFKSYVATTDPGSSYLNTPINTKGTAILKPGQYINSHKIGLHRNQYTALVQSGTVTVIRDFNKDSILDFQSGREESGYFGINIHRASVKGTTKIVDKYSAGCQVFSNIDDFNAFMQLCAQHKSLYGNNFTYTLLEIKDIS